MNVLLQYLFSILMNRTLVILLFTLGMILSARASIYRTYRTEDGLSHNSVWAVMQDSRGFMWFGTNDGLNRFDGLHFKVYRRVEADDSSIGSNFIHCLLETSDRHILVGTKEGLYNYDPSTDRFTHVALSGRKRGNDKTSVHCIIPDGKGNFWVGCYGQGIYLLGADMKIKKHFDGKALPSRYVTAMTLDVSGHLWVGTDNMGMYHLDRNTGKTFRSSISDCYVQTICRQNNNTLWVGTSSDGLMHYNPMNDSASRISLPGQSEPIQDIKAITPYNNNGEFLMGSQCGLLLLNGNNESLSMFENTTFSNLPDKSIFALAVDNEGSIWLGTYLHGVSYLSPRINAFRYFPLSNADASSFNIIRKFTSAPDGGVILTSANEGLTKFQPQTHSLQRLSIPLHSENLYEVLTLGDELWVSDYNHGIYVLSYPSGSVIKTFNTAGGLPSNVVNDVFCSSKDMIYIGTNRGAVKYDGTNITRIHELGNSSVMTILEDFNGNIWFATHFNGVYKMTSDGNFVNFKNHQGNTATLPGDNINTIMLDSKNRIWVGTEGEGLALLNTSNGKVEMIFSESNGLPSNIIYSIEEDRNGNIWTTTGGGLVKINGDNHKTRNFRYIEKLLKINYTHNSSLHSKHDGCLYFGGSGGFITFNPDLISTNPVVPSVWVTSYRIDGHPFILVDNSIVLEASESSLVLDIACLSYLSPEQNAVAYRLKGYDDQWKILNGRVRHIEYMNLPWGEYVLEVKGANNDGVWSKPKSINIKVNRPLLLSNAMLIVYLILFIFLCYLIKLRVVSVQRRKMVKFSHAKEKELYEAKIGFFTNIAHEIRTPLSLISAPLESILASDDGNSKTRHNLEVMRKNVERLLELINQLLDFRKVEAQLMHLSFHKCNVSVIVTDICSRYDDFANLHLINIDTKAIQPDIYCTIDAEAFEKIVGNLISNAMKYADKHICISMRLIEDGKRLRLEVEDDGPGIKDKDKEKIFESFYRIDDHGKHPGSGLGLPLARSLAELHSGSLSVESKYGHGAKFILDIPTNLKEGTESASPEKENHKIIPAVDENDVANSAKPVVLVVEDNEQLREFIEENLGEYYVVKTASNGVVAVSVLENELVDIIVSDIMMPDMDGIELCRVVRGTPEFSHIPIIILSAKTDIDTKVEGLNIGANAYLEKPFSIEQLKAQIKSILDTRNKFRQSLITSPLDYYKTHFAEDDGKENERAEFINKLNKLILDNLINPDFSIDALAQEFFMSRSSFHKRIKGITGQTPNDYIRIIRLSKSAELLSTGKYQIVEVCYMVGFNTPSYFSKCFAKHFGKLPKDYINDLNNHDNKTQL